MGALGDIRYTLTQSHYKRTTPCVSVCMRCCCRCRCVHGCMHYAVCWVSGRHLAGGAFGRQSSTLCFSVLVALLSGCTIYLFVGSD